MTDHLVLRYLGLPLPTEEEERRAERLEKKYNEYKSHFGYLFGLEYLTLTDDEIIKGIDRCIKYNRKWEGFIVPEIDYKDIDI